MSDKCEWKNGEFKACETHYYMLGSACCISMKRGEEYFEEAGLGAQRMNFCPFCGADIRKPEPVVKICRSGETWVAEYDGVDYLCVMPAGFNTLKPNSDNFVGMILTGIFKPISEIEITDEDIIHLHPNVLAERYGSRSTTIYAYKHGQVVLFDSYNKNFRVEYVSVFDRLATYADLQEGS